jgi:hypothetical protein
MALLVKKPSEIINARKWDEFLSLRKIMINQYKENNLKDFIKTIEKIIKIARGEFKINLEKLLKIQESEYKYIKILKELSLDDKELTAIIKN